MTVLSGMLRVLLCPGLLSALLVGLLVRGVAAWLGAGIRGRPAPPPWTPLLEVFSLAGKASPQERTPAVWPGLAGLLALSWATGLLPWPGWGRPADLPGDLALYLLLLAAPPLARLLAAGLSAYPPAILGLRRQTPLELARLLPLSLAASALPLATGQATLSGRLSPTLEHALLSLAIAALFLGLLPWPLWDRDEYDAPLAGLGGRTLAVFRALEAVELAAHLGLVAVALRAGAFLPPGLDGLEVALALLGGILFLAFGETEGQRILLPEAARRYTRWALPAAALVAFLGWWFR